MNASPDIRDIKGLFGLYGWYHPGIWLSVLFLLVVAGIFFLKRRKRPSVPVPVEPPKPPGVLALESLALLKEVSEPKPFHFQLSEILRYYLETRFRLPATDRTWEEIDSMLAGAPLLSPDQKKDFLAILRRADVVKFTDFHPTRDESLELLLSAETFVRGTNSDGVAS